jgi:hypothetical protein
MHADGLIAVHDALGEVRVERNYSRFPVW